MMHKSKRLISIAAVLVSLFPITSYGATLVAHYEFEDANNLGLDSSGLNNHADDVFEVEQVDGQFGQGAFFDEAISSSFVKFDGLDGFTGKPGVTLAAWVSLDEATTGFDGIISQDAGACCDNRILLHPENNPFINLSEHDDRHLTGAPIFEFEEWTHIAMTGLDFEDDDLAEARVYVNGEEVADSPQEFPVMDDGSDWNLYLGAGEAGNVHRLTGALDDVRVYEGALTADEIVQLFEGGGVGGLPGDFNNNNGLDAEDINLLVGESASGANNPTFDLNADNLVDSGDVAVWAKELKQTWIGDANVDGEFNSTDLVAIFQGGKFELDQDAVWTEGDWTGDNRFNSSDLVAAFQDGGFELGPRVAQAVPEPSACFLLIGGMLSMLMLQRKRS